MSLEANMELGVCQDGCDHDVADCYNKGYCYYEHLQEIKELKEKNQGLEDLCALCGKPMTDTESGKHYCSDCEDRILKNKDSKLKV